jgi:perosamine synthetase
MAIHGEAMRPYRGDWDWLLPNTNIVTASAIILPLFHEMTEEEQDWVIECLEEIGHHRRPSSPVVSRT